MAILNNLFKDLKLKSYDFRLSAMDDRKNLPHDFRANILEGSISTHILRSNKVYDFIKMMEHAVSNLVDGVTYLKAYKSYTVRRKDKNIR